VTSEFAATITHVPVAAVLVLNTPDDGRLTPETCRVTAEIKPCIVLHQVGVSFNVLKRSFRSSRTPSARGVDLMSSSVIILIFFPRRFVNGFDESGLNHDAGETVYHIFLLLYRSLLFPRYFSSFINTHDSLLVVDRKYMTKLYDIFVKFHLVDTLWQLYSTHLYINST
jgi:hypothetical protein